MKKLLNLGAMALMVSLMLTSCKKKMSDADLQMKANEVVVNFPNASVEVKESVAHLDGTFSTLKEKDAAIEDLKKIEGVKEVMDMATVQMAPMPTMTNLQKVNEVLKKYPKLAAEEMNGEMTITGAATTEERKKLKMSVDSLNVGSVKYNFTK